MNHFVAESRTSLKLGQQDIQDLLDAVSQRIESLEKDAGDPYASWHSCLHRMLTPRLLRFYRLRTRLNDAQARLQGARTGRSKATA